MFLVVAYYVFSRLFPCSLLLHPWATCGDTVNWSETWVMLAGLGAVAAAAATLYYARLVYLTLGEMRQQRQAGAMPVVVFGAPFPTGPEGRITLSVTNVGPGPALNVFVRLTLPAMTFDHRKETPFVLAASVPCDVEFDVPGLGQPQTDPWENGLLIADYTDVYRRPFSSRAQLTSSTPRVPDGQMWPSPRVGGVSFDRNGATTPQGS